MPNRTTALILITLLGVPQIALADDLIRLKDGRTFRGRLVKDQDGNTYVEGKEVHLEAVAADDVLQLTPGDKPERSSVPVVLASTVGWFAPGIGGLASEDTAGGVANLFMGLGGLGMAVASSAAIADGNDDTEYLMALVTGAVMGATATILDIVRTGKGPGEAERPLFEPGTFRLSLDAIVENARWHTWGSDSVIENEWAPGPQLTLGFTVVPGLELQAVGGARFSFELRDTDSHGYFGGAGASYHFRGPDARLRPFAGLQVIVLEPGGSDSLTGVLSAQGGLSIRWAYGVDFHAGAYVRVDPFHQDLTSVGGFLGFGQSF